MDAKSGQSTHSRPATPIQLETRLVPPETIPEPLNVSKLGPVKHIGTAPLPLEFKQAIAVATAWLHAQSAAHAVKESEHPRQRQSQQVLTVGSGCQDTARHPASPVVPGIGGGTWIEGPELPGGAESAAGGELPDEFDAEFCPPIVAGAPSSVPAARWSAARVPHADAQAIANGPKSRPFELPVITVLPVETRT
jgi:hypothetical protein